MRHLYLLLILLSFNLYPQFVPKNQSVSTENLLRDRVSCNKYGTFVIPNEKQPANAKPILEKVMGGVYISVGTERGFIAASLTNASHLLLLDYDAGVVAYNRIKIGLISLSKNIEDLRYLSSTASLTEWKKRADQYKGFLDPEVKKAIKNPKLFVFFVHKMREDSERSTNYFLINHNRIGAFKEANYNFYQEQYNKLKAMTEKGNISAELVDISDSELMSKIAQNIVQKGLHIGTLDISNAWQEDYDLIKIKHTNGSIESYDTKNLENMLLALESATNKNSILMLTNVNKRGFNSYLGFYFDYLIKNISEIKRIPSIFQDLNSYTSKKYPSSAPSAIKKMLEMGWHEQNAIFNPDMFSKDHEGKTSNAQKLQILSEIESKEPTTYDKIIAMNHTLYFAPNNGTIVYLGSGRNYLEWILAAIVNYERGFNRKIIVSDPNVVIVRDNNICSAEEFHNPVQRRRILMYIWTYLEQEEYKANIKNEELIKNNQPPSEYELFKKLKNINYENFIYAFEKNPVILTNELVDHNFVQKYGKADAVVSFAANGYNPLQTVKMVNLMKPNGVLWIATEKERPDNVEGFIYSNRKKSDEEKDLDKRAARDVTDFSDHCENVSIYVGSNKFSTEDILINGFSNDINIKSEQIDFLLSDLNLSDYNTISAIVPYLDRLKPSETTVEQRQKIEAAKKSLPTTLSNHLVTTEIPFNSDWFKNKAEEYSKEHVWFYQSYNTDQWAEHGIYIFTQRINERLAQDAPIDELVSKRDLDFITAPSGLMNYLATRIKTMPEGKERDANILALYSLAKITPRSEQEWVIKLKLKVELLIEEKMKDLEFRKLFESYKVGNEFDVKRGLENLKWR